MAKHALIPILITADQAQLKKKLYASRRRLRRWSRRVKDTFATAAGSIPASAGEPWTRTRPDPGTRVYPRECGGTPFLGRHLVQQNGLSPRVRGNPAAAASRRRPAGSIPASAGEPGVSAGSGGVEVVYPRECGGTSVSATLEHRRGGLSPRVRGNQTQSGFLEKGLRSIPASAGEPLVIRLNLPPQTVYPRECGGTLLIFTHAPKPTGLSPRVRGNLHKRDAERPCEGSIPASAGEPPVGVVKGAQVGVYPRECGGTMRGVSIRFGCGGLSPRVRGNPSRRGHQGVQAGSIPASAGEPKATNA